MLSTANIGMSIILLCVGTVMLTLHQATFIVSFSQVASPIDAWAPHMPSLTDERNGQSTRQAHKKMDQSEDKDSHSENADRKIVEFREPKDGTIKSISLLGERNTGTRWIYGHLSVCFNHTIPVHRALSRYKHWFQFDDPKIKKHTLSIAMFRDPMAWTWATKAVPHHAPAHIGLKWKEFVTKEWTTERLPKDQAFFEQQRTIGNSTGRICQEKFHYHELNSCITRPWPKGHWGPHNKHRFCQHQPFYEMKVNDPKGTPYKNILEMRADKIRNFMESATYSNVEGFWHYRYEELLKTGTQELIENIERATGLKRHPKECKIYEP